jgi:hypothetical protein
LQVPWCFRPASWQQDFCSDGCDVLELQQEGSFSGTAALIEDWVKKGLNHNNAVKKHSNMERFDFTHSEIRLQYKKIRVYSP